MKYNKGFTLIEILLVTSLLSIIGLATYGVFVSGMNIWNRVNQELVEEDASIFYKKISHDLRNTFVFTGMRFRGNKHRVVIPVRISRQIEDGPKKEIGLIEYSFDSSKKNINRRQADFSEVYHEKFGYRRKLVNNVRLLSFQYYYYDPAKEDYFWANSWQEEDNERREEWLPLAVRIKVILKDGSGEQNFIQTVSIPQGG